MESDSSLIYHAGVESMRLKTIAASVARLTRQVSMFYVALFVIASLACAQSASKNAVPPSPSANVLGHHQITLSDLPPPDVGNGRQHQRRKRTQPRNYLYGSSAIVVRGECRPQHIARRTCRRCSRASSLKAMSGVLSLALCFSDASSCSSRHKGNNAILPRNGRYGRIP